MRIWRQVRQLFPASLRGENERRRLVRGFHARFVIVDGVKYAYQIFVPPNWSNAKTWPVILSLHGAGGYGNDGFRQTLEGLAPAIGRHPERFRALAVFPQSPANLTPGWQSIGGRIALEALERSLIEFNGDASRITLTGLSIGGNGVWHLANHHPQRFAGLLPICSFVDQRQGTMYPILYPSLAPAEADVSAALARRLAHIPTWIFHGDADATVPVEHSRRMAAALRALGAPVEYTELPGVGHNAWDIVYDQPEVAIWLQERRLAGESKTPSSPA